jgi:hypothetical protein
VLKEGYLLQEVGGGPDMLESNGQDVRESFAMSGSNGNHVRE